MIKVNRAAAAVLVAAAMTGTTLAAASPASAASYKCKTSKKSIDDPGHSTPYPDNWDFTVKLCAKRSGSKVYAYSKITWDGPVIGDTYFKFDDAYFRLYIKKSTSGTDPVKKKKDFGGIQDKMSYSSSGNFNGSYTTGTISYTIGRAKGLGDGAMKINWDADGAGTKTYNFTASPRV